MLAFHSRHNPSFLCLGLELGGVGRVAVSLRGRRVVAGRERLDRLDAQVGGGGAGAAGSPRVRRLTENPQPLKSCVEVHSRFSVVRFE